MTRDRLTDPLDKIYEQLRKQAKFIKATKSEKEAIAFERGASEALYMVADLNDLKHEKKQRSAPKV
jgi:selenocysteine lyase/cysteine desulfurase